MLLNKKLNICSRLSRLAWIALFTAAFVTTSQANDWMDVDAISSTNCGTPARCCYYFTYGHAETGFNVSTLKLTGLTRSCWDVSCFTSQTVNVNGTPTTVTVTWNPGGNPTLSFNPAIQAFTQVEFELCPLASCSTSTYLGNSFGWEADDGGGGTPEANGTFTLNGCPNSSFECLSCDRTLIYRVSDCMHDVCYKRRSGSGLNGNIVITFNPPLDLSCSTQCQDLYPGTRDYSEITVSDNWTKVNNSDTYISGDLASFEIQPPITGGLNACEEVCITIPTCGDHIPVTVTMSDKNNPNDCSPSPIGYFKRGDGTVSITLNEKNSESNYPNPVTSASDFRTMIPFTISASAEARIMIMDESGRTVHTETQTFEGGGKHFFFFTGTILPTGSYYYTIESPLGVPIVKRTLLLVKYRTKIRHFRSTLNGSV